MKFINESHPLLSLNLSDKLIKYGTFAVITVFSVLPLFLTMPYRVNLYVTWEGAYRMWLGQIPYRDFGMPVGYGFWLIPYLSFVLFGPFMVSLLKAQAFINIISLVSLRGILKLFKLKEASVFLVILCISLSFVLINFWPWYNHTVFVFELVALYFALAYILKTPKAVFLILSSLFVWLSVLTKQDGGGLTLLFVSVLLGIYFLYSKNWRGLVVYAASLILLFLVLFVPFFQYQFSYWFNFGQSHHYSRINSYDFIESMFFESAWIKGYLFIIILLLISKYNSIKEFLSRKEDVIWTLFTLGILLQAMIIHVTSFSPPTGNLYFHSFALAYILFFFQSSINYNKLIVFVILVASLTFWQSNNVWKYSQKIFAKIIPSLFQPPPRQYVSKGNWAPKDTLEAHLVIWKLSDLKSLKKIKLPENTIDGINKIKELPFIAKKSLNVLNMTNLTPLAYELHYTPEKGENIPLWYHKGVAFFDRETELFCEKVSKEKYDLILFEDMPEVDNYYSYEVRDCALEKYKLVDKFLSPTGYTTDSVEVYVKRHK